MITDGLTSEIAFTRYQRTIDRSCCAVDRSFVSATIGRLRCAPTDTDDRQTLQRDRLIGKAAQSRNWTARHTEKLSKEENRKRPIGNRMITWPITSRYLKGQGRDPNTLTIPYDTKEEFNVDSKAEYTAYVIYSTRSQKLIQTKPVPILAPIISKTAGDATIANYNR